MPKFLILLGLLLSVAAQAERITLVPTKPGVSRVTSTRVVRINGWINEISAKSVQYQLDRVADDTGPIIVRINSAGGEVSSGEAILDMIEFEVRRGSQVVCVVDKLAASMAFNILSRCNERYATANAKMLFHKIAYESIEDKVFGRLTAKRLQYIADTLKESDLKYDSYNAKQLGMDLIEYNLYADSDQWWNAGDLVGRGFLKSVVRIDK